jgi:DNA-binding NarL/FixJ family response regulator
MTGMTAGSAFEQGGSHELNHQADWREGRRMKRVLIVADHSMVVHSIRLALRQTAGFRIVGFVDGKVPISRSFQQLAPDVVLVDDMQDFDAAMARVDELTAMGIAECRVLLTTHMDDESLHRAFEAGVHAAVSKSVHSMALGTLLREIAQRNIIHRYEPRNLVATVERCPLTDRELEILRLVAEGFTNGRIARELWVTEQTVKFHLSNTYRKLGVANRTEASRYAHVHQLVDEPAQMAS